MASNNTLISTSLEIFHNIRTNMRHSDSQLNLVGIFRISRSRVPKPGVVGLGSDRVGNSWQTHAFFSADGDGETVVLASVVAKDADGACYTGDAGGGSVVDAVKCDLVDGGKKK